ncbi:hypothetical protein CDD83_10492 [Cordyceps sp. RAO-2017]|nr:hypothetical protein CDD83_10492 [Cordyceps sp. RAO-2017]
MDGVGVALCPDPDDPRSALCFPTVLLYPLRLESDFVKAFAETETVDDHLAYVLPPPWDDADAAEYAESAGVACYVETRDGGLLKVGKRVPLLKVLSTGRVELVDSLLRIFVVPVAKANDWVATFKADKAVRRGPSAAP